jgi:hypothetical protein
MATFAELEIAIERSLNEKDGYPVVMRLFAPKSDQDRRFPETGSALLKIDLDELHNLRGEDAKYGARLSEVFFQDRNIQAAFENARAAATAEGENAVLRVRLFLDDGTEALHKVRWECLRDTKGKSLFNSDTILFSRYLASSELRPVSGKTTPKALIAIANPRLADSIDPEDPSKALAPVDVPNEKLRAENGLNNAGFSVTTLASPPNGTVPATSTNILNELANGYDVLYLVCHGGLVGADQVPMLWLEDGEDPVKASLLVEGIRLMNKQPRLVVLASCQSAGNDSKSASSTLGALGPLLAGAGVPAVIAMQGNIKMTTVKKFMPEFFKELAKDGQIDRAMAAARRRVVGDPDEPDCDDYWMPVLFMRLRSGRIWYQPGLGSSDGSASGLDKWKIIASAVASKDCQCTPIIGPGALEGLVGSWRDVATDLSESFGYPMGGNAREDLPTVTQFIAVNQSVAYYAKTELVKRVVAGVKKRWSSPAMEKLDASDLASAPLIVKEAGRMLRQQNPLEPHRLLASRPFSIYVTVNPDDSMEDALREAGRDPRSDFSRWNSNTYFDLLNFRKYPSINDRYPDYSPSVDQPLVYHLFGKLQLPDALPPAGGTATSDDPASAADEVKASREVAGCASCVITEDDFFDYMLTIGNKGGTKPVRAALASNALLFFGFRLDDWSFRVLLRSIFNKEGSLARNVGQNLLPCIGAQVQPDEGRIDHPLRAANYYQDYFQQCKIETFWGNVDEFARAFDKNVPAVDRFVQEIAKNLAQPL